MNPLIAEMCRIAEETSKTLNGEYVSVELSVIRSGDRTLIHFQGYTASGSLTGQKDTLEEVATAIVPERKKLMEKAKELRDSAEKIEQLAGGIL